MKKILLLLVPLLVALVGCDLTEVEDGANVSELQFNVTGLSELPDTLTYAAWIFMLDQASKPTIVRLIRELDIDNQGATTFTENRIVFEQFIDVARVSVTIEKASRFDFASESEEDSLRDILRPAGVSILEGVFGSNSAELTINKVITNTDVLAGSFTVYTPTDGNDDQNETSGIWFVDSLDGESGPIAGLKLDEAGENWTYHAFVQIAGTTLQIGGFKSVLEADDFSAYSDIQSPAPGFPGEDFLLNPPSGVTFPLNLSGAKVIIAAAQDKYITDPVDYILLMEADIPSGVNAGQKIDMNVVYQNHVPSGSANIVITH